MRQTKDAQLLEAIEKLNPKQKKALWGIVKVLGEEEPLLYDPWKDTNYVSELEQEFNDYKSGKITGVPFDEVHNNAREAVQKLRSKKTN